MTVSIIEPYELQRLLSIGTASSVVIDARPRSEFVHECIPGAQWTHWDEWCDRAPEYLGACLQQPGYWGVLTSAPAADIESRLSDLGLANDKCIIVYADGPASKGREGRLAWMLAYWGARDVRILNGGLSAWKASGFATETGSASRLSGSRHYVPGTGFRLDIQPERRTKLETLIANARRGRIPVMLDTRTRREFVGLDYRYMPRMGSVPDSLLVSHGTIFGADGRFLERDAFLKMMPAPVLDNAETVAFCEVGVRACNVALLFEIYTGEVMSVYDGSMMEWSADLSLPVRALTA